jgi:hypothetical protein
MPGRKQQGLPGGDGTGARMLHMRAFLCKLRISAPELPCIRMYKLRYSVDLLPLLLEHVIDEAFACHWGLVSSYFFRSRKLFYFFSGSIGC